MMPVCVGRSEARRLGRAHGCRARAGHCLGRAGARLNPVRRDPSPARFCALPLCPPGSSQRACLGANQHWKGADPLRSRGPAAAARVPWLAAGAAGGAPLLAPAPLRSAPSDAAACGAGSRGAGWRREVVFNRSGVCTKSRQAGVCPRPAAHAASHPGGRAQRRKPRPEPQPLWAAW